MAEYITRYNATIAATNSIWEGKRSMSDVADAINKIPSEDVAPVRHGRWIKESDGGTRCSVCNKRVRDVTGGGDEPVDLSDMPYCPKCGAKMYGGADNG